MGDVSIIARRLEGGTCVQYGWSGNGGYYRNVGDRLLAYYNDPEKVAARNARRAEKLAEKRARAAEKRGGASPFKTEQHNVDLTGNKIEVSDDK